MALNRIQYRIQKQFQFVHRSIISKCHQLHLRLRLLMCLLFLVISLLGLRIPKMMRKWNTNCVEEK